MRALGLLSLSVALGAGLGRADDLPAPGHRALTLPVEHRSSPLSGSVLYPAGATDGTVDEFGGNPVFVGEAVISDAAPADGLHPVVLLSHGLGGHHRTLAWLGAALARRGAIVVAVDHPGSTVRDFDMRRGLDHGTRATDLSAALDRVFDDPALGPVADPDRVYAAGFSYGGWTALSIGGLRGDLAGYAAHCSAVGARSSHCADIARAGVSLGSLDSRRWDASYRDPRVGGVVAIDPGLLYGLDAVDARELIDDTLLVGLGEGSDRLFATDFGPDGSDFAKTTGPDVRTRLIVPAGHYEALPVCRDAGEAILKAEGDDPVCTDVRGGSRAATHAAIIDAVVDAFDL